MRNTALLLVSADEYERLKDVEKRYNASEGTAGASQTGGGNLENLVQNAVATGIDRALSGRGRRAKENVRHTNPWHTPALVSNKNYTVINEKLAAKRDIGRILLNDLVGPQATVVQRSASTAEFSPKKAKTIKKEKRDKKMKKEGINTIRWYYIGLY